MDVSLAQSVELTCPECEQTFSADVWLIVDGNARPDLLEYIKQGNLHTFPCSNCGSEVKTGVFPLLLYLPERPSPVIFSPASQTTQEDDRQDAAVLVDELKERLGSSWKDAWLGSTLRIAPRSLLPLLVFRNPVEAVEFAQSGFAPASIQEEKWTLSWMFRIMQEATEKSDWAALWRLLTLPPRIKARLEDSYTLSELARLSEDEPTLHPLLQMVGLDNLRNMSVVLGLMEFVQAKDMEESRQIVEDHPELLSDDCQLLLDLLAREGGEDQESAVYLSSAQSFLRRCREIGVEMAFLEREASSRSVEAVPDEAVSLLEGVDSDEALLELQEGAIRQPEQLQTVVDGLSAGNPVFRAMFALLDANTLREIFQAASDNPILLTRHAQAFFMDSLTPTSRGGYLPGVGVSEQSTQSFAATQLEKLGYLRWLRGLAVTPDVLTVLVERFVRQPVPEDVQGFLDLFDLEDQDESTAYLLALLIDSPLPQLVCEVLDEQASLTTILQQPDAYVSGHRMWANEFFAVIRYVDCLLERSDQRALRVAYILSELNYALAKHQLVRVPNGTDLEAESLIDVLRSLQRLLEQDIGESEKSRLIKRLANLVPTLFRMSESAAPQYRIVMLNQLGLIHMYWLPGDRQERLAEAIGFFRQARSLSSDYPTIYLQESVNLAVANYDLARVTGSERYISQSIKVLREVLTTPSIQHYPAIEASAQMSLGNAYSVKTTSQEENLRHALTCYQRCLALCPPEEDPDTYASALINIGASYARLRAGSNQDNAHRAIASFEKVVDFCTRTAFPGSREDFALAQANLGNLYARLTGQNREHYLRRAILCCESAERTLEVETKPLEYASLLRNRAIYRAQLASITADSSQLPASLQELRKAVDIFRRSGSDVDSARSLAALGKVLGQLAEADSEHHDAYIEEAIEVLDQGVDLMSSCGLFEDQVSAAHILGDLLFHKAQSRSGRWKDVACAYDTCLSAAEVLYQTSGLLEDRQTELKRMRTAVYRGGFAKAREGDSAQAVELIEAYRARWLADALLRKEALLQQLRAEDRNDLERLRVLMDQLENRNRQAAFSLGSSLSQQVELSRDLRAVRSQLDAVISRIMEYLPDFFPEANYQSVQHIARQVGPLIYFDFTPAGGVALVVPQWEENSSLPTIPVWAGDLTTQALRDRVGVYLRAYSARKQDFAAWAAVLEQTTQWLWQAVMGPLAAALTSPQVSAGTKGAASAILVPTGLLGLLPLHAAWKEDPCVPGGRLYALDLVRFTYAPNARTLAAACARGGECLPAHLVAIDNPDGSLDFSKEEVEAILECFSEEHYTHLAGKDARLATVREALKTHTVWHFSTHGRAGRQDPLDSGLLLADTNHLTLRDILALEGKARLAVLSACETGIPGVGLPDEVLSLPSGLLQAGVAGVVGSLWAVNDFSTALLMMRFYQYWREEEQEPPEALRSAQRWLRDATNADLVGYFQRHLPEFAGERLPKHVADRGYKRFALENPDRRPFAHPFYWASFYYTGA